MRLLILYEELAWYFLNCLNVLCELENTKVLVYSKKINAVAPFKFDRVHPNIEIRTREDIEPETLLKHCADFKPDMVYLGGWSYKPYLQVASTLRSRRTVIGFDNQYTGSLKQILGSIYFRFKFRPFIQYAFVPGESQKRLALKLGFNDREIALGAYSADTKLFRQVYNSGVTRPKVLIFVGRYVAAKGIQELCEAFIQLEKKEISGWQLWCVGTGDYKIPTHPAIRDFGFKQPADMVDIMKEAGVFVLPSVFEPWGVVVHEFAAAGFPIISSNKVGAAEAFLKDGQNGFMVRAGNIEDLKNKIVKICNLNPQTLIEMSEKSMELSQNITPEKWALSLSNLGTK